MDKETAQLLGLPYEEEEGEETASITAAAEGSAAPQGALSTATPAVLPDLITKYKTKIQDYEKYSQDVLGEITAARNRLLAQPTQKTRSQYVRGLAKALTEPKKPTDPRFYERRNLYTFLRDVGEYGAAEEKAQKEAELKQKLDLLKLDGCFGRPGSGESEERQDECGDPGRGPALRSMMNDSVFSAVNAHPACLPNPSVSGEDPSSPVNPDGLPYPSPRSFTAA